MFLPGISKTVLNCTKCSNPICEGERYIDFDGTIYCEHCVFCMSAEEVFDMVGYIYMEAER